MIRSPRSRSGGRRWGHWYCAPLLAGVFLLAIAAPVAACTGDCDASGDVTIDEVLIGVNIALGFRPLTDCPVFDSGNDGGVTIEELLECVTNAQNGCPVEPVFPANYRDTYTEVRDCRFSIEHGGVSIRVLTNSIATQPYLANANPLPVGSVVLKEEFNAPDCSNDADLIQWRVMRKEAPGFDPQDGDWHWQMVDDDRKVVFDDKSTCTTCHNRPECLARDRMCTEGGGPGTELEFVLQRRPGALLSVAGTSATDVYAVGADKRDGKGPAVLHYDGVKWHRLPTGATGDLWWVSVTPIDGDFYMAGDVGLILQYDPPSGQFQRHTTPGTQLLFGVWGSAANNLWAVGGDPADEDAGGVVWHYDGEAWTPADLTGVVSGGLPTLYKVWGRSASDIYAVGRRGVVIHFNGTNWTQLEITSLPRPLFTVHGNDTQVAAVGGFFDGVILEQVGARFEDRTPQGITQMNGVFVPASGRAAAVGREGALAIRTANGWELQENTLNTVLDFHATWVDPDGGIWAVGGDLSVDLKDGILAYAGSRSISSEIVEPNPCPPSTTTGPTTVSFASDIMPLFNATGCVTLSCHSSVFPSSNYDLSSYDGVFGPGVEAKALGACNVVPGSPGTSYLIEKVLPSPRIGVQMPNMRTPLTDPQVQLIRTWILEGAQNN